MPRTRFRRSARAAPIPGWRTPKIWRGSSIACCAGTSPEALLESYHIERSAAADENIRESTRSTDFMAPQLPPGGAAAQGGAVARQGDRVRQAHGQWRAAVDAVDLRDAAFDRRWRCLARRPASRQLDAGRAGCERRAANKLSSPMHSSARACGSRCCNSAMARRRNCPKAWLRSASAARTAWSIRQVLLPRATTPSPAPPICCGPTAMSPRGFGIRPAPALDAALARAAGIN